MSRTREHPLTRSIAGMLGLALLGLIVVACVGSLPWTLGDQARADAAPMPRYDAGEPSRGRLPPAWVSPNAEQARRLNAMVDPGVVARIAAGEGVGPGELLDHPSAAAGGALREHWPRWFLGTDAMGRSLLVRVLAGGGISLAIGAAAALLSVVIGTLYGATAGYLGGRVDDLMMRVVDVLYGLPYVLLVILLAVASDALVEEWVSRGRERAAIVQQLARPELASHPEAGGDVARLLSLESDLAGRLRDEAARRAPPREISAPARRAIDTALLLAAIGGVSWLTMARVIRGQVLSLKNQAFIEAARALGLPGRRVFFVHLLPNLAGPIIVYATLTVPAAILSESFLSFLGIGVQEPLPSWGNLAAAGLSELNVVRARWWLLLFPCAAIGITLLALNFLGEGLRERFDPKRAR